MVLKHLVLKCTHIMKLASLIITDKGDKMSLTCWACSFCPHFSTGAAKGLGSHPLMCLDRFLWIFAGTNSNINFVVLDLKCTVPIGPASPCPHF